MQKQGTVKFFNESKGFGFIIDDETGAEVFVHKTAVKRKLQKDDKVAYNIEKGKKGDNAVNVKVIS